MARPPPSLRIADYLRHMGDAAARISLYTAGLTEAQFLESPMIQDAVIRNLEVIGEACRNILRNHAGFAAAHPEIPWRSPYEMRNALTHGYFGIDLVWTWETVQTDLRSFEAQIRAVLAGMETPEPPGKA